MVALLVVLASGASGRFHGEAGLVSSMRSVCPGSSFEVGVKIDLDPGWHTYWRNPGDTGISPTITWHLPTGWQAGEIQWPIPHKLFAPELVSYGYETGALLLVRLTAPKNAKVGSVAAVSAKVNWLVCREGCIPAKASLSLPIKIGKEARPDPVWMPRIDSAIRKLPAASRAGDFSASLSGKRIVLSFDRAASVPRGDLTFYADDPIVEPSAPEVFSSSGDHPTLTLKLSQFAPASVPRLRGLLVSRQGPTTSSLTIDIPLRRTNP